MVEEELLKVCVNSLENDANSNTSINLFNPNRPGLY